MNLESWHETWNFESFAISFHSDDLLLNYLYMKTALFSNMYIQAKMWFYKSFDILYVDYSSYIHQENIKYKNIYNFRMKLRFSLVRVCKDRWSKRFLLTTFVN